MQLGANKLEQLGYHTIDVYYELSEITDRKVPLSYPSSFYQGTVSISVLVVPCVIQELKAVEITSFAINYDSIMIEEDFGDFIQKPNC